MTDEIGNVSVQRVITPSNNTVFDKNNENEKSEKYDQTKTKNVIENGKLIVEQYDKNGKLICKTPPGYLLPGEKG
jgi:hypothetical protein